ncbi:MAG TPA: GNAT family N-acetyltransferase [Pyrinomonadaceae bacterium]|nr:GNAT family N-acetyltransferase [Pyrinomonadaceae bacterium]
MNRQTAMTFSESFAPLRSNFPALAADSLSVAQMTNGEETEVLNFLAARPLHTVFMSSMIRDNGIISPLNRGLFYGCRNAQGQLLGVALIGHATLIEARSAEATEYLARVAQSAPHTHMIMGERERIEEFWSFYAEGGQSQRLMCREILFEQRWPIAVRKEVRGLRQATLDDLEMILPVHAQMAFEESGINPLEVDAEGFRKRCARRIESGRVWVWVEAGRLIFKADIIAETSSCIYLEGIYVNQSERGKGYGLRCLSQLSRSLLMRASSVCLLVNERNLKAHEFYLRAGYKVRSIYDTIFLY